MSEKMMDLLEGGIQALLICPACRSTYLRQRETRTFQRQEEDGPVWMTMARFEMTCTAQMEPQEAEEKRDYLDIDFSCESGCTCVLRIYNLEGQTILEWIEVNDKDGEAV